MNKLKLFKNGELYGVGVHNDDNSIDLVTFDGKPSFADDGDLLAGDALLNYFHENSQDDFGFTDATEKEYDDFIAGLSDV